MLPTNFNMKIISYLTYLINYFHQKFKYSKNTYQLDSL